MRDSNQYKEYKTAEVAYDESQANTVKINDNLTLVQVQEEELLNKLGLVQAEHDQALGKAASAGDMSLLDKATKNLNDVKAMLQTKENERLLTEKVLDKAKQLVKLKQREKRESEKQLLISIADELENEVVQYADGRLRVAWMARSSATGHYSYDSRNTWFKSMFPMPPEADYDELKKLFN